MGHNVNGLRQWQTREWRPCQWWVQWIWFTYYIYIYIILFELTHSWHFNTFCSSLATSFERQIHFCLSNRRPWKKQWRKQRLFSVVQPPLDGEHWDSDTSLDVVIHDHGASHDLQLESTVHFYINQHLSGGDVCVITRHHMRDISRPSEEITWMYNQSPIPLYYSWRLPQSKTRPFDFKWQAMICTEFKNKKIRSLPADVLTSDAMISMFLSCAVLSTFFFVWRFTFRVSLGPSRRACERGEDFSFSEWRGQTMRS